MEVFFEPGAQANPNRGLKLFVVGLVKNWLIVPGMKLSFLYRGSFFTCCVTVTYGSLKFTREDIRPLSSTGTVVNSYRIPIFNVNEGRTCQLSWK